MNNDHHHRCCDEAADGIQAAISATLSRALLSTAATAACGVAVAKVRVAAVQRPRRDGHIPVRRALADLSVPAFAAGSERKTGVDKRAILRKFH